MEIDGLKVTCFPRKRGGEKKHYNKWLPLKYAVCVTISNLTDSVTQPVGPGIYEKRYEAKGS